MSKRLTLVLLIAMVLTAGCLKETETPVTQPQGTFSGKFYRLKNPRYVNGWQIWDTTKINLTLLLSGNNYMVGGDTVLHAGSKGTFEYNRAYLDFHDITIPANNSLPAADMPRIHLAGTYPYQYDGINLRLKAWNDTLVYYYELKK